MAHHLPIQASIIVSQTTHQEAKNNSVSAWLGPHVAKEQQRLRLARPTCRQAKLLQTAWRYSLTARRQRLSDPTVFSSPPGGSHRAARRLLSADPLTLRLSPGGLVSPPGAIPEQYLTGFSTSTSLFYFQKARSTAPDHAIAWRRFACRQAEHQYLHKPGLFIPATASTLFLKFIAARRIIPKQEQHSKPDVPPGGGNEPPGGFWKNPETSIQQCRNDAVIML
ncbi:hypothetical protein DEO72_LG2g3359 [Vigna unguiculata]|uniref:Uncharacterized protein n=1 Tax=Vigna unguiculata TaxID=3917 RepID=A0A4D6L3A4_VIGUN|nr:hypothetical protein DEO72_LG2g3359 [Vigna unguiculata]